jgi:nitrile hydratase beta subunit
MNGVHDMGGMQGFGPVVRESDEPVFHAAWEGRVIALRRILGAMGRVRQQGFRPALETLPPADYLGHSYYLNWLDAFTKQLLDAGLVTLDELTSGKMSEPLSSPVAKLTPQEAAAIPFRKPVRPDKAEQPKRFAIGQSVRVRNLNPSGHTRLPRYVRGKLGSIVANRGIQPLADTDAHNLGAHPQYVYGVRFAARELWGEQASPRDSVYVELWDSYLDAAA